MLTNTKLTPNVFDELGYWIDNLNSATSNSITLQFLLADPAISKEILPSDREGFNTRLRLTVVSPTADISGQQDFYYNRLDLAVLDRCKPNAPWPATGAKTKEALFNNTMAVYDLPLSGTELPGGSWVVDANTVIGDDDVLVELEVDASKCFYFFGKFTACARAKNDLASMFRDNIILNDRPLPLGDLLTELYIRNIDISNDAMPWERDFDWVMEPEFDIDGVNSVMVLTVREGNSAFVGSVKIHYNRFSLNNAVNGGIAIPVLESGSETMVERVNRWVRASGFQYYIREWDIDGASAVMPNRPGTMSYQTSDNSPTWSSEMFEITLVGQPVDPMVPEV